MKKILFVAALFIASGTFSSCSKENDAKPSVSKKVSELGPGDKSTLATGDGSRPTA